VRSSQHLLAVFARRLRRAGCGISEPTFPNQHQIADVNDRIGQISQDSNRIAPEKKIQEHDDAAGDTPVPERHRDHALALSFRCPPLDEKTHREGGGPNQAENHEIIPVEAKKTMFVAEPRRGNKG